MGKLLCLIHKNSVLILDIWFIPQPPPPSPSYHIFWKPVLDDSGGGDFKEQPAGALLTLQHPPVLLELLGGETRATRWLACAGQG